MQTTQGARAARSRRAAGYRHRRAQLGPKERRRLVQLALCLGLFLVVLLGRGIRPDGLTPVGERLLSAIRADTNFAAAFSTLGEAISGEKPVMETLGEVILEVFGAGSGGDTAQVSGPATQAAVAALHTLPTDGRILEQLGGGPAADDGEAVQEPSPEPAPTAAPEPTPEIPPYDGPALPEGTTMDYVPLGLGETVTPVLGVLTSPFGYRDHPVDGTYAFHYGTDLAADPGTPVQAFADGTVDFIGESEAYGLYIQINHGSGVTSFYCHCSALYAQKGEKVTKGQTIAAVGDTGNATGPHLHLELKQDGVFLNPLYYIETAED